MAQSLMEQIALLPEEERREILSGIDMESAQWDWSMWGRPEQFFPEGNWRTGLFLAGRGSGKTRAAAEWIREKARDTTQGHLRFLIVARTAADARQTMITGDSGILAVTPPSERPEYKSSVRELVWPNGNTAFITTADEPDSLRGPQAHYAWGDEIAAWRLTPDQAGMTAWGNLRVATRLGKHPQVIATTTPKRVPILFDLIKEEETNPGRVFITRGSTIDNAGNLGTTIEDLEAQFGSLTSNQARQEIFGEMLDAIDGALWTDETMIKTRYNSLKPPFTPLRLIGVDPSVAENPTDECGIIVVGSTADRDLFRRQAWVIEDCSIKASPSIWAQAVVDAARRWDCAVVAEKNQGGVLVRNAINQIDPSIPVYEVWSKVGKKLRAEPIALAYEQGRVKHMNTLPDLENQMLTWMPETSRKSPDRVDAMVHALTALLIAPPSGYAGGNITAKSFAHRTFNAGTTTKRNQIKPTGFRVR